LPFGLLICFLFQCYLKKALYYLSPNVIRLRLYGFNSHRFCMGKADLVSFLVLVLSISLGAVSHIIWDEFTHQAGWGP